MPTLRNLFVLLAAVLYLSGTSFGEIEAVKGKRYPLSKKHGPWMIMVAAIRDVEEGDRRTKEGMSAWEAADQMVYELRKKGIPAYTFALEEEMGHVASPSLSEAGSRRYIAQHGFVSVLAGNFKSNNDKSATGVLNFIKDGKKFNPEFLSDEKNGGILPRTPGRPSPLSRAFLTINPLWEGDVRTNTVDGFIVDLNAGQNHSLLQNKGKYTLTIATFSGNSVIQVGSEKSSGGQSYFDKTFGDSLENCATNAMTLTDKMRNAKKYGYDMNYEAWVYHDKYRSIVTIGSFDSKDDPRIRKLISQFGVKTSRHPQTGNDMDVPEVFTIPRQPKPGRNPDQSWLFDPTPRLMQVPKVN